MKQKAVIIGGYQKLKSLIPILKENTYDITIINDNYDNCIELEKLKNIVIYGDGTKEYILEQANINNFDLLICLCKKDEDNLVSYLIAKKKFNVKRAICLVNDHQLTSLFYDMGVDYVISPSTLINKDITSNFFNVTNIRLNVFKFKIRKKSKLLNKKIKDLKMDSNSYVDYLIRDSIMYQVNDDSIILENDIIVIKTNYSKFTLSLKD